MDAQTTLERAERELQRYQALYEKGAVSEQTVDNYRFARNNAQGKLSEAQGVWDNMQDKLSGASVTRRRTVLFLNVIIRKVIMLKLAQRCLNCRYF